MKSAFLFNSEPGSHWSDSTCITATFGMPHEYSGPTSAKFPQKFASLHASVHNHFNQERHLCSRQNFKLDRSLALAEWRQISV